MARLLDPSGGAGPGLGRRAPAVRLRHVLLPVVLAVILAVLELLGTISDGYVSGWGDHFVLSPEGLSWAHPGAFANDWFMEVAPQPHWFFDVLTFVGESLGALSLFYVAFWALGLLAFGVATALLAYRFVPAAPGSTAVAVTVLTAITPWMIGGTGSPVIAQALPAVLSGHLIYLLVAGMLTERRVLVVVLAPLVAIVHVQQGSIAIVLLAAMLVVEGVRLRRLDWSLLVAFALTVGFVVFGLTLRPVASNLQDFVRICDQIIPYHCAAHAWNHYELLSTGGLILLAFASGVVIRRQSRWIWFTTVGLATFGYAAGFAVDALHVPVLGPLAQGVNVYRLGAVLLPFAIWGAIAPMIVRLRGWRLLFLLAAWAAGWGGFLVAPGWQPTTPVRVRVLLLGLALLIPIVWFLARTWKTRGGGEARGHRATRFATLLAGVLALVVTVGIGGLTMRTPNFAFIGNADLRTWGEQVRQVVPEGSVLVASPRFEWVKLISQRAVIADCKDVPYGGAAWDEWQRRLGLLGGYEQCVAPGPLLYDDLPAQQLVDIADQFETDYIVVNPTAPETVRELEDLGWERVVGPVGTSGGELLRRR